MAALTNKEEKRLERLQEDADKDIDSYSLKGLNFPDLLLLLKHDPKVKKILLKIVRDEREGMKHDAPNSHVKVSEPDDKSELETETTPSPVIAIPARLEVNSPSHMHERIVYKDAPVDTLRADLATPLALLAAIEADAELCQLWLGELSINEGEKLMKLVANAANWDRVEALWDLLASRCKNTKQPASENAQRLLQGSVMLHNLTWQDRAASLLIVGIGDAYDFKLHDRGTPNGETITAVWLPGLQNAAGHTRKKTLVATV